MHTTAVSTIKTALRDTQIQESFVVFGLIP